MSAKPNTQQLARILSHNGFAHKQFRETILRIAPQEVNAALCAMRLDGAMLPDGDGTIYPVGKWFLARYGYEVVCGKCLAEAVGGGLVLSFRWGDFFRNPYLIEADRVIGPTLDPRLHAKLGRAFRAVFNAMRKERK